jgi:hypothetical protein
VFVIAFGPQSFLGKARLGMGMKGVPIFRVDAESYNPTKNGMFIMSFSVTASRIRSWNPKDPPLT